MGGPRPSGLTKEEDMKAIGTFALAVLLSPGGSYAAEKCPPLKVTADGQDVRMMPGFAKRVPEADGGGGYIVSMFNHGEMDCATYLKTSRPVKDDELEVRAYVTKKVTSQGVNFSTELGAKVFVVDEPRKAGDKISVCVPEPIVHTGDMAYKNKKVVVQGLLTGGFCEAK